MVTMTRIFFRHLKEAFQSLTRNLLRSFVSIIMVSLTMMLVGVFSSVLFNINDFAQDVANDLTVKVYIDLAATDTDKATLKSELTRLENVSDIQYVDKDKELDTIVKKMPAFKMFDGDSNPLYDTYVVTVLHPEDTITVAKDAQKLKYVVKASYGGDAAEKVVSISKAIQMWGAVLIGSLIFIAVLLISNTVRLTIISRQTEIEIMRLVGATKWFIRWPFLLEGALLGFLGSIAPVVLIYVGYIGVYEIISAETVGTVYSLIAPDPFLVYLLASLTGIGILIGALGSVVSIGRFLRK